MDEMPSVRGLHRPRPAARLELRDLPREFIAERTRDLVEARKRKLMGQQRRVAQVGRVNLLFGTVELRESFRCRSDWAFAVTIDAEIDLAERPFRLGAE